MRPITGHTRVAAVIGDPIRHSLSPALLNAAFEAAALDWVYVAFPVPAGQAAAALEAMRVLDLGGLSVTMPHKDAVAAACDELSPAAAALGAVNCVARRDGRLVGHNTDGPGFVDSLLAEGVAVRDRRCVVVGAGGAARAIVRALADAGAAEVAVVNRTPAKAEVAAALAGLVGRVGRPDDVTEADLVVNATSIGMLGDPGTPIDAMFLRPHHVVVDAVYRPAITPLLAAAADLGARTVGGLGMLIHQAGHAFTLWTGHDAPVAAMTAAAERLLAST